MPVVLTAAEEAGGDVEFIYGLQALMAFEEGSVWQRQLTRLADDELPLDCPNCGEFLILSLDGPEFTTADYTDSSIPPTPVRPGEPVEDSVEGRILWLPRTLGRPEVAARPPVHVRVRHLPELQRGLRNSGHAPLKPRQTVLETASQS